MTPSLFEHFLISIVASSQRYETQTPFTFVFNFSIYIEIKKKHVFTYILLIPIQYSVHVPTFSHFIFVISFSDSEKPNSGILNMFTLSQSPWNLSRSSKAIVLIQPFLMACSLERRRETCREGTREGRGKEDNDILKAPQVKLITSFEIITTILFTTNPACLPDLHWEMGLYFNNFYLSLSPQCQHNMRVSNKKSFFLEVCMFHLKITRLVFYKCKNLLPLSG